ncbi:YwqG family protein [Actinoplanes sichuanensis]|uniref:YwqG family protein n=1 Tax=Actinoplanes sichuanensis TaxID=512349 RepID=A0ABW4ARB6_9ACTN|nr:YwqG family protein [Actinoplanes sichuanensis]BEL05479.1 YwqG family protein [Actinoplanes sichuanensis]
MGILESTANAADLIEVARTTLPPAVADTWIGLLRPAVRFRRAEVGDVVVGQLGGAPALPEDLEWPRSTAGRPLGFVAGVDLARVPTGSLDIPLPADGRLLMFYRDPSEDPDKRFWISDPVPVRQPPTGHLVFGPAGTQTTTRTEPGAAVYPEIPLAMEVTATGPDWDHPALEQAVADLSEADRRFMAEPSNSDDFRDELSMRTETPHHYLGGYAHPVQRSVEFAAAMQRLGSGVSSSDPALWDEARQWTSLMQIDSDDDAEMMWGDSGSLYWVIRRDDLAAGRFDAAAFLFQCH